MISRFFSALRRYGFGNHRTIPGLDGLRALSIGFVLISHLTGTAGFPHVLFLGDLGNFGVRIFFIISGFLITDILLKEWRKNGKIALPRFYFRRILRLFPACYVFMAAVAFLAAKHWTHLERWDMLFGATYTMNYHETRGWP